MPYDKVRGDDGGSFNLGAASDLLGFGNVWVFLLLV